MLRIRLRRPGKSVSGKHHFKVVVTEITRARESRFIEQVGHYNPVQKLLKFDVEKYESWVKKGAKPTDTVASLFKRYKKVNISVIN